MFSKADLSKFLAQAQEFERKMMESYQEILQVLEDPKVRTVFESLRDSESRHQTILQHLQDLL